MTEEQPPGAESSSEEGTAAAENQPPRAAASSEEGTAAENQPLRAAASSAETPGATAGDESAGLEGAEGADSKRGTLCRSSTDKVIAGVAGGIGAYFGIDAVIVRIAFIVLTFLGGAAPIPVPHRLAGSAPGGLAQRRRQRSEGRLPPPIAQPRGRGADRPRPAHHRQSQR